MQATDLGFELLVVLAVVVASLLILLNVLRKEEAAASPAGVAPIGGVLARLWRYYKAPFRRYAVLRGRATRREYWVFTLANNSIVLVLSLIDRGLGLGSLSGGYGPLSVAFTVAILIPSLAVTVRRLHDGNRAGTWVFVHLLPLLGWFVSLYQTLGAGTVGKNRFGASPRKPVLVRTPAEARDAVS